MNITFLGTGGAFDFEKGNASAIVELGGKNILIDCGFSTLPRLAELNLLDTIDYILITHLHGDHIGGLPTLVQYLDIKLQKTVPIITPNDDFRSEIHNLLEITFAANRVAYETIEHVSGVNYIDTSNQHGEGITSHAYYFAEKEDLIYYSGDIGNADTAADFLKGRTESNIIVFHETTLRTDMVNHTSYKEVQEKLGQYDTYVYHIAKENMPADCTLKYVEDYPEFLYQ